MKEKIDAFLLLLMVVTMVTTGCGEETPIESPLVEDPATLGELKVPEDAVAAAPAMPNAGLPFVKEVNFYSDWQRTKPAETVKPGDTIFIEIVFSEAMTHVAADDKTARPLLFYCTEGKKQGRFTIKKRGVKISTGDARPLKSGTNDYIAKYVIRKEDEGHFRVAIGKKSADKDGNEMAKFYTHKEKVRIGAPPTVTQVNFYSDKYLIQPITPSDTIHPGDDVYTKIQFSESMQHIAGEEESARPDILSSINGQTTRYRIARSWWVEIKSGDCKPTDRNSETFTCRVTIPPEATGTFGLLIGANTMSKIGISIAEAVEHAAQFTITKPPEPELPEDYSFTFESGETYPGYNPSPGLQHILDTHPSAKLPYFEEAVKMVEVIDWVFRKRWVLYPDWETNQESLNKIGETGRTVLKQFGISRVVDYELTRIYFDLPYGYRGKDAPIHSKYWFDVEYLRLKLQYLDESQQNLLLRFSQSKDNVVGLINPNN